MTKRFLIAGVDYDKETAESLRQQIIDLRDTALKAGYMEWTVMLSHCVAFLAKAIEEMWKEETK